MGYYVSRQNYYYSGEHIVEVESNGRDYSGPDMLVAHFKKEGEGQEFDDPRDAIKAAIAVRDAWRKLLPGEEINIGVGTTGGMGLELEPTSMTDEELGQWAEERWEAIPKCDRCGDPLPKHPYKIVDSPDWGSFCSDTCAEYAYAEELEILAELDDQDGEDDAEDEDE